MSAYTTSTNVGMLLGTAFTTSTDPTDDEVASIIARVQAYIDTYMGRIWTTATASEYHDTMSEGRQSWGGGSYWKGVQDRYFLRRYPLVGVTAVRENTAGLGSAAVWQTRSSGYSGDFLIYPEEGYIEFHKSLPQAGRRNLFIAYTYGEATTPNDIKYACELLSASETVTTIARSADQSGLSAVTIGDASYSFAELENQRKAYNAKAMAVLDSRGRSIKSYVV